LRINVGRFHQPEGIHELQVLDGVTRFFKPQVSDQVLAGVEWHNESVRIVGEIYYKWYSNPKGRFENMFNPFSLLPEMEPDRVGIYPDKASAGGLDIDASLQMSENMTGNISYSYMDAEDKISGRWVNRRWSQRNTVNTGISWKKDSLSVSLAATWHSGWHSTKLPQVVDEGTVIPVESVLNNTELQQYFSLDFSTKKSWDYDRAALQIYADISNITDRSNQAGIDFDVLEVSGGYKIFPDQETLLGRVISLGITLSF